MGIEKNCAGCRVGITIAQYQEAGRDSFLARKIAVDQKIGRYEDEILMMHYRNTAETLLKCGCKMGILCRSRYEPRNI